MPDFIVQLTSKPVYCFVYVNPNWQCRLSIRFW